MSGILQTLEYNAHHNPEIGPVEKEICRLAARKIREQMVELRDIGRLQKQLAWAKQENRELRTKVGAMHTENQHLIHALSCLGELP